MGYVYLLITWDNCDPVYKIGVTKHKNIDLKRIKSLQTGNSSEILLVRKYESVNYFKIEKMLHNHYFNEHIKGEWFKLTDEQANEFTTKCKFFDKTINLLLKENPFYN